jgi:transposase InsO family protein
VPLHPHETSSRPFEIIHFDLKNLTRTTRQQNKYLLVAVDAFSKYPFIEALPDSTASTCAKALVKIVASTGVPRLVISDRASYWTSETMRILMEFSQVKHRMASSLNPQSNGAAERMIQSVTSQIRLLADTYLEIENVIPLILINLRSAVDPTTQKSSHEVVFG